MVARYDPIFHHDDGTQADMEESINGDWVSYDDYMDIHNLAFERAERIAELEDKLDDIRRIAR